MWMDIQAFQRSVQLKCFHIINIINGSQSIENLFTEITVDKKETWINVGSSCCRKSSYRATFTQSRELIAKSRKVNNCHGAVVNSLFAGFLIQCFRVRTPVAARMTQPFHPSEVG